MSEDQLHGRFNDLKNRHKVHCTNDNKNNK